MADQVFSAGPANQTEIPSTVHNLPASIAPNGIVNSNLIAVQGYTKVAVGLTMSQPGSVAIQRYLDARGTVRVGNPISVDLAPGIPAALTINDGQLFGSFQVIVTNEAGSTALIGNLAIAVASDPATLPGVNSGSFETATSTVVSVPPTSGGAILLAANPNAAYRAFRCPKTNTKPVWLALGSNPEVGGGFVDLQPGDIYEMTVAAANLYQGAVTAIAQDEAQDVLVTEGV